MATLSIHIWFPAGRYHGTGWGRHVNEGRVDWPPAPWRLLRALVAVWHNRLPGLSREVVQSLMRRLSSSPPAYCVPPWTGGHTRHYMPTARKPICVLDAFVALKPEEPLVVQWEDLDLPPAEAAALRQLLARLTWLGRAESWCRASLGDPVEGAIGPAETPGAISLLTPEASCTLEDLEEDTATLRKSGAVRPRRARFVTYPAAASLTEHAPSHSKPPSLPTVARYTLNGPVLPRVLTTVRVAERLRAALLNHAPASEVFSGRREGQRLAEGHRHAHFLPEDLAGSGRLDHIWVYASGGLPPTECAALARLRWLHQEGGRPSLRLSLVGLGSHEQFQASPRFGTGRVWESWTPFLLTRHPHRRAGGWRDGPADQLRRELNLRGLPEPVRMHLLSRLDREAGRPLRWIEFRRWKRHQQPAWPLGYGFRLEFPEPVTGPLALGFGSHFGLGAFCVARNQQSLPTAERSASC